MLCSLSGTCMVGVHAPASQCTIGFGFCSHICMDGHPIALLSARRFPAQPQICTEMHDPLSGMATLLIVVGAVFIVLECSKRILRPAEENKKKKGKGEEPEFGFEDTS